MNVVYTSGMDKTQIRAELDKLGVVYNARLGEDKLMAILEEARKKGKGETGATAPTAPAAGDTGASGPTGPDEAEGASGPTEPSAPAAEPEAPAAPSGVVKIIDRFGMVCRTYSLETHGDDYVSLAQEFAKKKGLRIA